MNEKINLEIIIPDHKFLNISCEIAVIPGIEGELGIMAHHISIISTTIPGIVKIYENEQITHEIFVSSGFVNVENNIITLIVDRAFHTKEITKENLQQDINLMKSNLTSEISEYRKKHLTKELQILQNIFEITVKH